MDIGMTWLMGEVGNPLTLVCYLLAAGVFAYGLGSAVSKLIGNDHHTIRDVLPSVSMSLIGTGIMYAAGTFLPSLLA